MDVYSNRDKRYGLAEQTVWGTPTADAANVIELDCEHLVLPVVPNLRESPQVHASRVGLQGDVQADTYQATPEFSLSMDAKQKSVDHLLYAFFQQVTEAATTPFSKTFTFPTTQPDFSTASAGYTATIFERDPVAAHSLKVKNAIAKSLAISVSANGRAKVVAGMVGLGYPATSTPSGTWTRTAYEYFHAANVARFRVNFGAGVVSLVMKSLELSLSQEVIGVGQDGSGNFVTWGILSRAGTFKMQCVKDANILTARTNLAAGTAVSCNVSWGNASPGTVDGDFDLSFAGKLTNAPYDNEDLLGVTIEGRVLAADASTAPVTIIMANATDRGW